MSSRVDDRSMHELYLWPFADSVKAGVASVMCSYNKINGQSFPLTVVFFLFFFQFSDTSYIRICHSSLTDDRDVGMRERQCIEQVAQAGARFSGLHYD